MGVCRAASRGGGSSAMPLLCSAALLSGNGISVRDWGHKIHALAEAPFRRSENVGLNAAGARLPSQCSDQGAK